MDQQLIKKRFEEIGEFPQFAEFPVESEQLDRFISYLLSLKGEQTVRINPLDFAQHADMDSATVLSIFIYGSKSGLFSFEWNFICPVCGGREHSYENLNQLEKTYYRCTLCDLDVEVVADSHLEISFTLRSDISGYMHDPFLSLDSYWAHNFSHSIIWPDPLREAFDSQQNLRFFSLDPGKKISLAFGQNRMKSWRMLSFDSHAICSIDMGDLKNTDRVEQVGLTHDAEGFTPGKIEFSSSKGKVDLVNNSDKTAGFIIGQPANEHFFNMLREHPPYFTPFVTGKMILNNQLFRELFLVDNLPDDLSMKIQDITLLFTDLKGATELYDKTGDIYAYRLVKKHFRILQKIVNTYNGGIVKTMGDAIVASFNDARSGLDAASAMVKEINAFNSTASNMDHSLGLKIGLHRGEVIAVKANQTLDYFDRL